MDWITGTVNVLPSVWSLGKMQQRFLLALREEYEGSDLGVVEAIDLGTPKPTLNPHEFETANPSPTTLHT